MDRPLDIQQLITNSPLTEEEKRSLLAVSVQLYPNLLNFLTIMLKRSSLPLVGELLVQDILDSQDLVQRVEKGDTDGIIDFFQNALSGGDYNSGEYAVPALLDVIKVAARKKITFPGPVTESLKIFRILCFRYLSKEQQVQLLQTDLLYFLARGDPLSELKRLFFPEQAAGGSWTQPYQNALLNNQEQLGKQPLLLDGKKIEPTLKNWLSDFIASSQPSIAAGSTYDAVKYMSTASNAARLTKGEQNILFEIFKVYNWLKFPLITEDEVQAYNTRYYRYLDSVVLGQPITPMIAPSDNPALSFRPTDSVSPQRSSASSINMRDVLNRQGQGGGVVFDNETNVQVEEIGQRLEAERQQKQSDIDKKLADLKKRR